MLKARSHRDVPWQLPSWGTRQKRHSVAVYSWFMNDELNSVCKKVLVAYARFYPAIIWRDWGKPRIASITVASAMHRPLNQASPVFSFPLHQPIWSLFTRMYHQKDGEWAYLRPRFSTNTFCWGGERMKQDEQAMYVQRNVLAPSLDVFTSSSVLPAWYHFTGRERFYYNVMWPGKNEVYFT